MRFSGGILAACAAFGASAAGAETLPVNGIYPAGNDAAATVHTIVVERFGGADGEQLGIAIADALRAVRIDGEPYFRVLPARSDADFDAVLQGTATAELSRTDASPREEETCVERDKDRKCTRKEKQKVPCWNAVAQLDSTLRLIATEGDLLHAADQPEEMAKRYCRGEDRPSGEGMVRQLVDRVAARMRADLAPVQRLDEFRVMETRKGLSGDAGRAFRDAVELTKSDAAAACAAWSALEAGHPDHIAVLFDLGLCAESRGALAEADAYYRRALAAEGDAAYAQDGLQRIEARRRADSQLAARAQS
jgi:hypothetical protein